MPTSQRHDFENRFGSSQTWPVRDAHQLQLVTQDTLNPAMVIGDVAVFQKEAQYAVLSKSSAEFKQWCHKSLAKSAAGAHAFLRKADEPPHIHVTFNDKREMVPNRAQSCP